MNTPTAPFERADNPGGPAMTIQSDVGDPRMIVDAVESHMPETGWLADLLELSKFRLSLLVLVVTAAGYCFSAGTAFQWSIAIHVVLGTALVAFAANSGNQVMESRFDRLMGRTQNRPLPAERITRGEAILFSIFCGIAGSLYLYWLVNPLAAFLAAATLALYLVAYTPMKRVSPVNTLIGAIPGAIPPMIGVAAGSGALTIDAWLLFAILFFWQLPHFFAIAWLYREDYGRGGYKMLSVVDPTGRRISRQTIVFSIILIMASLAPAIFQRAGYFYLLGAAALGYGLLVCAGRFALERTAVAARSLLLATIAYLPVLMGLLLADRLLG